MSISSTITVNPKLQTRTARHFERNKEICLETNMEPYMFTIQHRLCSVCTVIFIDTPNAPIVNAGRVKKEDVQC